MCTPTAYLLKINKHKDNKAEGRISKRVFQENKARQIYRKTNFLPPDTPTLPYYRHFFCFNMGKKSIYMILINTQAR